MALYATDVHLPARCLPPWRPLRPLCAALHVNPSTHLRAPPLFLQAILGRIARVDYAIPPEMEKSPELRDLIWWVALAFGSRIFGWFLAHSFALQLAFL